jgi:glutamate dehydrogenase (NAD(P)+)
MANVDSLRAKLVLQGANIPVSIAAEQRMHERGILSLPDFIVNAGGVICAAMEHQHGSQTAAFASIEEKIRENTRIVLETARDRRIAPREAAMTLAHDRVLGAMTYRRF